MKDIIKKELNMSIIASILYAILGIIIIANPAITLSIVSIVISISAIIYGIIISIINIASIKEERSLTFGILLVVLGIALLIYPGSVPVLISLGVGIWFISNSISRIKLAILLKDAKESGWIIILCSAIITLLIGISFIFTPLISAISITIANGILMVVYSIIDIFEIIFIKKNIDKIQKAVE